MAKYNKITDDDAPIRGVDIPKPKVPEHLDEVDAVGLPKIELSFWAKVKRVFSKLFSFATDTVKAVNGFNSTIKWVAVSAGLILIIFIIIKFFS